MGHADAAVLPTEEVGISGRGILPTSVAVVDHVVGVDVMLLEEVKCLVERTYATFHLQRWVEVVPDKA